MEFMFTEFKEVSETKYLVSILQVLCAYQTTLPEVFREHPVDFGALLEGVRTKVLQKKSIDNSKGEDEDGSDKNESDEEEDEGEKDADDVTMLQLCLLKLLAQSDVRQLSWTKEVSGF